jgi:hypothetical protein
MEQRPLAPPPRPLAANDSAHSVVRSWRRCEDWMSLSVREDVCRHNETGRSSNEEGGGIHRRLRSSGKGQARANEQRPFVFALPRCRPRRLPSLVCVALHAAPRRRCSYAPVLCNPNSLRQCHPSAARTDRTTGGRPSDAGVAAPPMPASLPRLRGWPVGVSQFPSEGFSLSPLSPIAPLFGATATGQHGEGEEGEGERAEGDTKREPPPSLPLSPPSSAPRSLCSTVLWLRR